MKPPHKEVLRILNVGITMWAYQVNLQSSLKESFLGREAWQKCQRKIFSLGMMSSFQIQLNFDDKELVPLPPSIVQVAVLVEKSSLLNRPEQMESEAELKDIGVGRMTWR